MSILLHLNEGRKLTEQRQWIKSTSDGMGIEFLCLPFIYIFEHSMHQENDTSSDRAYAPDRGCPNLGLGLILSYLGL